jgi:hypothetical protein
MSSPDVIALLALFVSAFTFYWTSLRNKKAFYLVRIDNYVANRVRPEFALVNAGNKDILVTSVLCAFEDGDGKGWISPDDQIHTDGENSFSIPAGKTKHCKIDFTSNFDEEFIKRGILDADGRAGLYHKYMMVIVEWVDAGGNVHKASPKIVRCGFNSNGHITISKQLGKRHDLYKLTEHQAMLN